MKPRNNREREAVRLSHKLHGMTKAQRGWVAGAVVPKIIHTAGKSCWCTECGSRFEAEINGSLYKCPHCGKVGHVSKDRKTTGSGQSFVQILQVFHGWQVIRYFSITWRFRRGERVWWHDHEVMQKWCQPGRPTVTLGANLTCYPYYRRVPYSLWSSLSVKDGGDYYGEWMELSIYPKMSLLKPYRRIIREKGLRLPEQIDADTLIAKIYSIPYFEALFKREEFDRLKMCMRYIHQFSKYWPSVRIALRHGYPLDDLSSYFDHLRALAFLHYDMRSPRYVAPPDFAELHDLVSRQYRNKVAEIEERKMIREQIRRAEAAERAKEEAAKCEASFTERMARFAGFSIKGYGICIIPLMTIQEFADEGAAMHHCVFNLGYYKRPDSLILSARDSDGNRVETIEVNIKNFTIIQSRGVCNQPSDRHQEIVDMVAGAMPRIHDIVCPKRGRHRKAS